VGSCPGSSCPSGQLSGGQLSWTRLDIRKQWTYVFQQSRSILALTLSRRGCISASRRQLQWVLGSDAASSLNILLLYLIAEVSYSDGDDDDDVTVTAPLISLNSQCGPTDVCADVNAACLAGRCRCTARYYEKNAVCGSYVSYYYLAYK